VTSIVPVLMDRENSNRKPVLAIFSENDWE